MNFKFLGVRACIWITLLNLLTVFDLLVGKILYRSEERIHFCGCFLSYADFFERARVCWLCVAAIIHSDYILKRIIFRFIFLLIFCKNWLLLLLVYSEHASGVSDALALIEENLYIGIGIEI